MGRELLKNKLKNIANIVKDIKVIFFRYQSYQSINTMVPVHRMSLIMKYYNKACILKLLTNETIINANKKINVNLSQHDG